MHPVLLKTPYFTFYTYGLFTALAVGLAFAFTSKRSARHGLIAGDALDLLFLTFAGGLVGARLFYVGQNWPQFQDHPANILRIDQGGLVWYGGFLLAVALGVLFCLRKKQSMLPWADFFAPILAASHAVGRLGCFMNGCCGGRDGQPTQLYEAAGLAVLAAFLFSLAKKGPARGSVISFYLLGYGVLRFGLEFIREGQPSWAGLTPAQWISLGLIVFAFFIRMKAKTR